MRHHTEFHGPLEEAFSAILDNVGKHDPESDAEIRLDAARIINGILEERKDRMQNGQDTSVFRKTLIPQAIAMGSAIYREAPSAGKQTEDLQTQVESLGFLNRPFDEDRNEKKVKAFTPEAIDRAFQRLKNLVPPSRKKPILLLAIADGATAPVLALYEMIKNEMIKDETGKEQPAYENSTLEIVKYDPHADLPDPEPIADKEDLKRFRKMYAKGAIIVTYNDHQETGVIERGARNWAIEKIADNAPDAKKRVIGLTNDPGFGSRRSRALMAADTVFRIREGSRSSGIAVARRLK